MSFYHDAITVWKYEEMSDHMLKNIRNFNVVSIMKRGDSDASGNSDALCMINNRDRISNNRQFFVKRKTVCIFAV